MSNTRHNNIITNVIWIAALSVIVLLLVFSVMKKRTMKVERLFIEIEKFEGNRSLITKKDVLVKFRNFLGYDIKDSEIRETPVGKLEALLLRDKRVRSAELYIDKRNRLHVVIKQRRPILRVAGSSGEAYYLDQDGEKLELRKKAAIRVPLATGNIATYKVDFLEPKKKSTLKNVFLLAKKIDEDKDFLSPLIEQIHVKENKDMVLIPKVGRQKIQFGDFTDVDDKLYKLKIFYRDGLSKEGWNKYEVLRLDFKDQVVGQKKM